MVIVLTYTDVTSYDNKREDCRHWCKTEIAPTRWLV